MVFLLIWAIPQGNVRRLRRCSAARLERLATAPPTSATSMRSKACQVQDPHPEPSWVYPYTPLLKYPGPYNLADGTVAIWRIRAQAQPGICGHCLSSDAQSTPPSAWKGSMTVPGSTSRADLLGAFLDWAEDEPLVTIADATAPDSSHLDLLRG